MCEIPNCCWRQCPCGQWFIEPCTTAATIYCEDCRTGQLNLDQFPNPYTFPEPIILVDDTIVRSTYGSWKVISKGGLQHFMYKFEDGWKMVSKIYFKI